MSLNNPDVTKRHARVLNGLGIGLLLCFLLFLAYQLVFLQPNARKAETELGKEFELIQTKPGFDQYDLTTSYETDSALVNAYYFSNSRPRDIFEYYDQELKTHNWQFHNLSRVLDWSQDLGGWSSVYCKGDYAATIQYAGNKANYGWTYEFSMTWGFKDCEERVFGGFIIQNLPDSVFIALFGAVFCCFAGFYGLNAWRRSPEQYLEWRKQLGFRTSKIIFSPRYVLWNDRIFSVIGFVIGLFATLAGLLSLVLNFL